MEIGSAGLAARLYLLPLWTVVGVSIYIDFTLPDFLQVRYGSGGRYSISVVRIH
jgi:hypothetical protein